MMRPQHATRPNKYLIISLTFLFYFALLLQCLYYNYCVRKNYLTITIIILEKWSIFYFILL